MNVCRLAHKSLWFFADSIGEIGGGKRLLVCPFDRRLPKVRIVTSQAANLSQNRIGLLLYLKLCYQSTSFISFHTNGIIQLSLQKYFLNLPSFLAFPKVLRSRYWLNQIMVIYFLRENITVWLTFCFASIVLNQTSKYVVNFNVAMRL